MVAPFWRGGDDDDDDDDDDDWTSHDGGDCVTIKTPIRHPTVPLPPKRFYEAQFEAAQQQEQADFDESIVDMAWGILEISIVDGGWHDLTWEMFLGPVSKDVPLEVRIKG